MKLNFQNKLQKYKLINNPGLKSYKQVMNIRTSASPRRETQKRGTLPDSPYA